MNIEGWLEKTVTSIRSTDPKVLMTKMEEYGLIEDDVESVKAVPVFTADSQTGAIDDYEEKSK